MNFDEMILEAAKSIAAATSALIKAAGAAQKELIISGNVSNTPLTNTDDGQWSEGLISAARMVAAATHSLVESANALVQGLSSEEKLISSAKQVAGSTAQLLVACKVKSDLDSDSTKRLQAAGNAVKRATDNLVRAAQQAIQHEEERSLILNRRIVGGIAQEINARSEVLRIERELEEARGRLTAIRQAKYRNRGDIYDADINSDKNKQGALSRQEIKFDTELENSSTLEYSSDQLQSVMQYTNLFKCNEENIDSENMTQDILEKGKISLKHSTDILKQQTNDITSDIKPIDVRIMNEDQKIENLVPFSSKKNNNLDNSEKLKKDNNVLKKCPSTIDEGNYNHHVVLSKLIKHNYDSTENATSLSQEHQSIEKSVENLNSLEKKYKSIDKVQKNSINDEESCLESCENTVLQKKILKQSTSKIITETREISSSVSNQKVCSKITLNF